MEQNYNNEDAVMEYLNSYFEGNLNEDTSDDDIMEAVIALNELCEAVNEYFLSEE
jgi:hypothetical protein|tara:strand:- start:1296 stop:1460 length:165 start_codon:yes stop_codon:yes gene_type:complete